ncbi:MAG: alpha amylase C-terminal domain-containing protein, partial [Clostridia bacterium]|nr:alpha amylase C-terminal domain-containing protein [Clostridia bacterium]
AQFIEWNYERPLDWFLLSYDAHKNMQNYVKELNKFYLKSAPLYEIDYSWEGFSWISSDDSDQSIIAFRRMDKSGRELICVCNFVPVARKGYRIGVPKKGNYRPAFCSDYEKFGGKTAALEPAKSEEIPMHGFDNSISIDIPAMSVTYYKAPKQKK